MPGFVKVTLPGFWAVDVAGEPPGNTHEYFDALLLVPKVTVPPAGIVTSDAGESILPEGGVVE